MSHQHSLVDFGLPEPAGLLASEKHLYCHFLSSPAAKPHLAIAPLSYLTHHLDLFSYSALHLEKKKTQTQAIEQTIRAHTFKQITFNKPNVRFLISYILFS